MTKGRTPPVLWLLGGVLVVYLGYPVGAFLGRVLTGHQEGWKSQGLWSALRVSAEGATISLIFGALVGIPLAYVLARRRGWLVSAVSVLVQLPLAIPPLISGILLVYIVGPYTFLGQLSGERLTQTMFGVIVAQTFVSTPFLVVVARSAFRSVDPTLADVAATLGHRPLARFLRVEVHAASEGIRAGMVLMWLRAFGEYGTVVVLAYHPYSLPVYVENLFSSAPLSQAEAPTLLTFGVAVLAIAAGGIRTPRRVRRHRAPAPQAPVPSQATPVGFDLKASLGSFHLTVAHAAGSHRLAILGPSGSGKSMTLRGLAGLLGTRVGRVAYGGVDVSAVAPERRRIGYVPQGPALMPNQTVWQQATFGVNADPARAAWWLETLHLDDLGDRYPSELSGGQRQRVSLARALASAPDVVLLDEPFSALDAPVRDELRREVRRLQRETGLSTVLVTHDPEEAALLADEIMVVSHGRLLQAGSLAEVYRHPASSAVARLLGMGNIRDGVAARDGVVLAGAVQIATRERITPGTAVLWSVPATRVTLARAGTEPGAHPAVVTDIVDFGASVETTVTLQGGPSLRSRSPQAVRLAEGDACGVHLDPDAVVVWPAAAESPPTR
jgi:ABC-type sulfate/molybdate transport systems ATPase subunit/ABC-type sulfate transport system permease component